MDEEILFPSPEWANMFCRKLNENQSYRDSAKKWEGSILFVVTELPQELEKIYGRNIIGFELDLWHGECRGSKWFENIDDADSDYILEASYKDWVKIVEGNLDPIKALITRKMKVKKGSIATIMRFTLAAINMVKTAQLVPTKRYE